jgi:thioredoxin reductase
VEEIVNKSYDVIIIGAGPAGMSAALYTSRLGLSTLILESDIAMSQLFKTETIENYLGSKSTNAQELADAMIADGLKFGAELKEFETVKTIIKNDNHYKIITTDNVYNSKTVLVATGTKHIEPEFKNYNRDIKGISFCAVCDAPFYKDGDVIVYGGGDTAFENAILLSKYAKNVTIVIRSKIRAKQYLVEEAKQTNNIEILTNSTLVESVNKSDINKIIVNHDGQSIEMTIDGLFISIGSKPDLSFLNKKDAPLWLSSLDYLVTTGIPLYLNYDGLFYAGDVGNQKHQQVAIAIGEGAKVALEINDYIIKKGLK